MTIPSSSGWAEERGSGSEDEYGVGDPIDQRMAEYHIIKSHRDSSPVEPTKVTLAMKGETFLALPDPTPQPTMSAPDLPDRSPPEDSIMERTCFCFGRRNHFARGWWDICAGRAGAGRKTAANRVSRCSAPCSACHEAAKNSGGPFLIHS